MKAEGFRFQDDEDVLTTKEMAEKLGIPESRLRHMERSGRIPTQKRASNETRMWRRGSDEVPNLAFPICLE